MHRRPLLEAVVPTVGAATLGNALIGRDAMTWFRRLRAPGMQLPMPGFYAVGAAYYLVLGGVAHRASARGDARSYRLAMVVLAGNEIWNAALFGRRSTRAGFLGILAFLVPLAALQASVRRDRASTVALGIYTAYVVGYDVPWTYQLWRLNRPAG